MNLSGLHHVTAIASDPQRNLDFYVGGLGLRLVKRTVNFDDPGSYHFYFGDHSGSPGTILTFFPWPNARRGTRGSGETESTAFGVPEGSLGYWKDRLTQLGVSVQKQSRFGQEILRFTDPDGMLIELVGAAAPSSFDPWLEGPVPRTHAIRGFHGITLSVDSPEGTSALLTGAFGYRLEGEAGNRARFVSGDSAAPGSAIDLVTDSRASRGRLGAGSVHHVAFRISDDTGQVAMREQLSRQGIGVSPIMERTYFRSIYFREPNGVLFELATDDPGFATDESIDELGTSLRLPSWMESSRERIEAVLPTIHLPKGATA